MPDLPDDNDPVRSFVYCAATLDLDLSTFRRRYVQSGAIPIEEISQRRRGVRDSVLRQLKRSRTRQPSPVA